MPVIAKLKGQPQMRLALASSILPSNWTLVSFNLNLRHLFGTQEPTASLDTFTIICGRRFHGPHDGILERLRVQLDLRRSLPGGGTPGEADAGRHLGVRGRRVRQRAGVHRAAYGVSGAGESPGTHPRHLAGDVDGSSGLREYGSYPLP